MAVNRLLITVPYAALALSLLGCGEDVGDCQDPEFAQDTVLVNGSIQYGGQAIMNLACAQGCHSSDAEGAAREGAPAGLNFDLRPIDPQGEEANGTIMSGDAGTIVNLDPKAASGLRERQRRIFEDRNRIWQQVKDGLMPPSGEFAKFRSAIMNIMDTDEQSPCTATTGSYEPITEKPSQDVLRMWLACGAPIVESTSPAVDTYGAPGQAGYQYPACEDIPGDGGVAEDGGADSVVTIETVHERIFDLCTDCHSPEGQQEPDLSTPELAYAALVENTAEQCEGKPFVTPGEPEESFFYEIVAQARPACKSRMPPGGALSTSQLALISEWIAGGALREADVEKGAAELQGGLDAGVQ